jgi:hypothetical protein
MTTVIDRATFRRGPEPYLGWYLEGQIPKSLAGVGGKYEWYAQMDRGGGQFAVKVDASRIGSSELETRYETALRAGQAICHAKIFLGTWLQDVTYSVALPRPPGHLPQPTIRGLILRGLYSLYETGFDDNDIEVDILGVALELAVEAKLVRRAIDHLFDSRLIEEAGTLGRNRSTGHISISGAGVTTVESNALPVEAFLQEVYFSAVRRIAAVAPTLGTVFEDLRSAAGEAVGSSNEVVGFAARVRDFVERFTDSLCEAHGIEGPFEKSKTVQKVRALTARAKSETQRDYVRALAEVVEAHWTRLNPVQQQGVHVGLVESQRLFAYTVLFVADLLDVLSAG